MKLKNRLFLLILLLSQFLYAGKDDEKCDEQPGWAFFGFSSVDEFRADLAIAAERDFAIDDDMGTMFALAELEEPQTIPPSASTKEEKINLRRNKNKAAAANCRKKRKDEQEELMTENEELRTSLEELNVESTLFRHELNYQPTADTEYEVEEYCEPEKINLARRPKVVGETPTDRRRRINRESVAITRKNKDEKFRFFRAQNEKLRTCLARLYIKNRRLKRAVEQRRAAREQSIQDYQTNTGRATDRARGPRAQNEPSCSSWAPSASSTL